ncbi:MAG: hypothetical protein ABIR26_08195 [Ramlibacter sp.]
MNHLSHTVIKNLVITATLALAGFCSLALTDFLTEVRVPDSSFLGASPLRR